MNQNSKHLLIIEDDHVLREGLALALSSDSLNVHMASSIEEAWREIHSTSPDILLLDMNLPDGTGIGFCKEFRKVSNAPVIFVTVCDSEIETVSAFRVGATDYVTKPFSVMVLRERINAALGRNLSTDQVYEDSKYYFNFTTLVFKKNGESIYLSTAEQKILRKLIEHKGNIITRQILLESIWDCDSQFVDDNALTVSIKRLRTKIGTESIKTAYGLGYYWNPQSGVEKVGESN